MKRICHLYLDSEHVVRFGGAGTIRVCVQTGKLRIFSNGIQILYVPGFYALEMKFDGEYLHVGCSAGGKVRTLSGHLGVGDYDIEIKPPVLPSFDIRGDVQIVNQAFLLRAHKLYSIEKLPEDKQDYIQTLHFKVSVINNE